MIWGYPYFWKHPGVFFLNGIPSLRPKWRLLQDRLRGAPRRHEGPVESMVLSRWKWTEAPGNGWVGSWICLEALNIFFFLGGGVGIFFWDKIKDGTCFTHSKTTCRWERREHKGCIYIYMTYICVIRVSLGNWFWNVEIHSVQCCHICFWSEVVSNSWTSKLKKTKQ